MVESVLVESLLLYKLSFTLESRVVIQMKFFGLLTHFFPLSVFSPPHLRIFFSRFLILEEQMRKRMQTVVERKSERGEKDEKREKQFNFFLRHNFFSTGWYW